MLWMSLDPSDAQRAAEAELAKSKYHPRESWLSRGWRWLLEHFSSGDGTGTFSWLSPLWIAIAVIVAALVIILIARSFRRTPRPNASPTSHSSPADTAALLLQAADSHTDPDLQVLAYFRAAMTRLDEIGVIRLSSAMTATEVALAASATSIDAIAVAEVFNAIAYGHAHAHAEDVAAARHLAHAAWAVKP
ncbi:DUF4129 domain-containing protein [Arcanobacterium canis]